MGFFSYSTWSFWNVKWGYHYFRKHPYIMIFNDELNICYTEERAKGHVLPLSTTPRWALRMNEIHSLPTKGHDDGINRTKSNCLHICFFHAKIKKHVMLWRSYYETFVFQGNQARHAPMTNGFGEVAGPGASTPRRTAVVARSMSYKNQWKYHCSNGATSWWIICYEKTTWWWNATGWYTTAWWWNATGWLWLLI